MNSHPNYCNFVREVMCAVCAAVEQIMVPAIISVIIILENVRRMLKCSSF